MFQDPQTLSTVAPNPEIGKRLPPAARPVSSLARLTLGDVIVGRRPHGTPCNSEPTWLPRGRSAVVRITISTWNTRSLDTGSPISLVCDVIVLSHEPTSIPFPLLRYRCSRCTSSHRQSSHFSHESSCPHWPLPSGWVQCPLGHCYGFSLPPLPSHALAIPFSITRQLGYNSSYAAILRLIVPSFPTTIGHSAHQRTKHRCVGDGHRNT
ncbi:hypothetical protein BV22DRAFT_213162 [Leucogyrophana mollusca]|uniref:Uncharacterized protein n=1 Tax=Leucogyrophana mollusca TaxID=85980 RepID=A0ACB8BSH0_9AGAM|nr:hypothetical protein BV22DRAFT_213162 [Leucogyrophana mollusca]